MAELPVPGEGREIAPKDVFKRSNMPSRWERLTSVAPKIDADRTFLVFVAARYRGEPRLPHPDDVVAPVAMHVRSAAAVLAWAFAATVVVGLIAEPMLAIVGATLLACALVTLMVTGWTAGHAIRGYKDVHARAVAVQSRLDSDRLNDEEADTLNEMIHCDEGTLSYCAAKIASEIERDPAWHTNAIGFIEIDLWDELAEVGASAHRIAQDREATEQLERGRLRDDPDARKMVDEDKLLRRDALAALAARVHSLADYRDRVQRVSARESRDRTALDRAVRLASDEQARDRPV